MYRRNKSKTTRTYKKLRKVFRENFISPHFTDYIKDGISFKWYYNQQVSNLLKGYGVKIHKFFEDCMPPELFRIINIKIIYDHYDSGRYNPEVNNIDSIRVLVDLRNEWNSEPEDWRKKYYEV